MLGMDVLKILSMFMVVVLHVNGACVAHLLDVYDNRDTPPAFIQRDTHSKALELDTKEI